MKKPRLANCFKFKLFYWLYSARPQSLTLGAQFCILILCMLLGCFCSVLTVDTFELGSYLSLSFVWMFAIILFADYGGYFNDNARHLTFWLNFMPSKVTYLLMLWLTFGFVAALFSILGVLMVCVLHLYFSTAFPSTSSIGQAILHQSFGLWMVALFNYGMGAWLKSGMRQMICVSWLMAVFFLSSVIPYFFAFDNPWVNHFFELAPRLDLYDNRTALLVGEAAYPWIYTGKIALYVLGQAGLWAVIAWLKLEWEGWK